LKSGPKRGFEGFVTRDMEVAMNFRPLSLKKKFQLVMLMTLVIWATTTLVHQWGYGAEVPSQPEPTEKFVADSSRTVTLEIRSEVTIHEPRLTVRQLCRWSKADEAFFAPMADLVIAECKADAPFHSISIDQVRQTLHDAGVNVAAIRFSGPTLCTITRSDVHFDENQALNEWISARHGGAPATAMGEASKKDAMPVPAQAITASATTKNDELPASSTAKGAVSVDPPVKTLRDLIMADASSKLGVPVDQLQLTFNPIDDKVLSLPQSQFKFHLDERRVYNLGDVAWDVQVITDNGVRKFTIRANARAWETQLVVSTPLGYRQVLRDTDVTERRTLVDRIPEEALLTRAQAVGQQAARDLKPGTVLTARMVDPVQLIKTGQFVTVTLDQGAIRVKTVVRALENGSYGQTIRVKNESTHDTYEVVVTGPQEGSMSPTREESKLAVNR